MSDKIDKMADDYIQNLLKEKDDYIKAQENTILKLQKQVSELKEELKNKPTLMAVPEQPVELGLGTDQEEICKIQLRKFLEVSKNRELTLEETRKVEIFSKILFGFKNKDKEEREESTKKLSSDELLKLVETKLN